MTVYLVGSSALVVAMLAVAVTLTCSHTLGSDQRQSPAVSFMTPYPISYRSWCMIVGEIVLLASFALLPYTMHQTNLFVDYLCIDQADAASKRAGAMSLGSFLQKSRSLLILWDSKYLTRGWTIYEVAAFLSIHAGGSENARIDFLPYRLTSALVCVQILILFAFMGVEIGWQLSDGLVQCICIIVPVCIPPYWFLVAEARRYASECALVKNQLQNFDVLSTSCTVPADRSMILENIKAWHGSLDEFNKHVRLVLADQIQHIFGQNYAGVPYSLSIFSGSSAAFFFCDISPLSFREAPNHVRISWAIMSVTWVFCGEPLILGIVFLLGKKFMDTPLGWSERSFNFFLMCLSLFALDLLCAIGLCGFALSVTLGTWIPSAAVLLLYMIITLFMYRPRRCCSEHLRSTHVHDEAPAAADAAATDENDNREKEVHSQRRASREIF